MAVSKFLDPKNDVAFKKIFGSEKNKGILIHFINDIMGFSGGDQIQNVTFLSPVQDPEIAYKKQSIVNVLCSAENGTKIIVEMQVSPSKGFEKRAQYYAAKAYSRQLAQGQDENGVYANLKEVIFIAISDYNIFPQKSEYLSHHVILDKITYEHDLKDFSFSFIELPKFQIDKIENLKTIIEKWCYFFKYAAKTSEADLKLIIGSDLVIEHAYEALNQFNWNETELIAYEQEIKRIMDNRAADDYIRDKRQEIEARGKAEGKAEGETKKAIEIAKKMLIKGKDIAEIIEFTDLSKEQIEKLKSS
jgi:predicted transposase/invertase (TIGR01784 family)